MITPSLTKSYTANRAAIDAADHEGMNRGVRALRDAWVGHWFPDAPRLGTYDRTRHDCDLEFAKRVASNCLNDEQRIRLAIHLVDVVEGIGEDDRTALDTMLGETLSGVQDWGLGK